MKKLLLILFALAAVFLTGCRSWKVEDINIYMRNETGSDRNIVLMQNNDAVLTIKKGERAASNAMCWIVKSEPLKIKIDRSEVAFMLPNYKNWHLDQVKIDVFANKVKCDYVFHDKKLAGDDWESWWNSVQLKKISEQYKF